MAKTGSSKQKKMNARVDFTPMVDMIMLLVTFFMLCTTLIKPQTMEIAMPSDVESDEQNQTQVEAKKAITVLLGPENTIYYCIGNPATDPFKETTYGKDGIRAVLQKQNATALAEVQKLKEKFALEQSSDPETFRKNKEAFQAALKEIKEGKETPNVIIRPSDESTYDNLMSILDEMQICSIGKYMIDKFTETEQGYIDAVKNGGGAAQ
ncbi:MAG: biopolymer transporter ExbD [Bacteroidaceae bacterium]|nr:biopolymer transporter ExbD [Bacteroidaceae bacterium]